MKPNTITKIGAPFPDEATAARFITTQGPKFTADPARLGELEQCLFAVDDATAMAAFAKLRARFLSGDWLASESTPRAVKGEVVVLEEDLPVEQVRRSAGGRR